jgi:hypothetical protein
MSIISQNLSLSFLTENVFICFGLFNATFNGSVYVAWNDEMISGQ